MVGELSLDGWIVSDHPKNPLPEAKAGGFPAEMLVDAGGCGGWVDLYFQELTGPRYQISV